MDGSTLFLAFLTISELALVALVILFFSRLRRSEELLQGLQKNQDALLKKLDLNARLEQELVSSFHKRQTDLAGLNTELEKRTEELTRLLRKADEYARSPEFLRQIILSGRRKGQSVEALARSLGLSADEVELIVAKDGS